MAGTPYLMVRRPHRLWPRYSRGLSSSVVPGVASCFHAAGFRSPTHGLGAHRALRRALMAHIPDSDRRRPAADRYIAGQFGVVLLVALVALPMRPVDTLSWSRLIGLYLAFDAGLGPGH